MLYNFGEMLHNSHISLTQKIETLTCNASVFVVIYKPIYCFTTVLAAIVTPPVRAKALPSSVAPVLKVIDCIAKIVPLNTEVEPNVTELPTCQKMFDADALPLKITLRPEVVVSVDAI